MAVDTMRVISIRQPWAWLIFNGKRIENRTWETTHRGPILIHAGSRPDPDFKGALAYARERGVEVPVGELEYGGIVGQARVVNCVRKSDSPWFMGPIGWELADAMVLPFVAMPGKLGLFDPPDNVLKALGLKPRPVNSVLF
jgi:hypothetical protein